MSVALFASTAEADPLENALESLFEFSLSDLPDLNKAAMLRKIAVAEAVNRRSAAIVAAFAGEVADRSRYELGTAGLSYEHGQPKPGPFLEEFLRISGAEANRRIALGLALRPNRSLTGEPLPPRLPALSDAFDEGDINTDAAAIIVRAVDDVRRVAHPDHLDIAEKAIVDFARHEGVQNVTRFANELRLRLDPDGVLPREEETRLRRGIKLGRERNGIVPIGGGLAPEIAALVQSTFDEANAPGATPRFLSDEDREAGTITTVNEDGTESIKVTDTRTREQRQHDVLAGIVKAGIRNAGTEPGQLRSHAEIVVHVSAADLEAGVGVGHIDGIEEPISMVTVEQILCDATVRKVILGNDGEILALGRKQYSFTSAQRVAVVARDGDTCLLCDAPASWCDMHHVTPYRERDARGRTDVCNAVLLCERHHQLIHNGRWRLSMIHGIPHVLAPPEIDPTQTWKRKGRRRAGP